MLVVPMNYDEPLWEQIKECLRMLDVGLMECKKRGHAASVAKAHYYTVKTQTAFAMREEGYAVTFIQETVKGIPEVNTAMSEWDEAEVLYENAREARNVWKKKLDTLREQYGREWAAAKEE